MPFTDNEIQKYLDILSTYTKSPDKTDRKISCSNCQNTDFDLVAGFVFCVNCGKQNGRYFDSFDKRDQDRLLFRKKSIYQRKYHFEKKVNQVSKRLNLSEDEKYNLYSKLLEIDNRIMEKLNKQFNRKRMISIVYLIKKILEEKGNEKFKLIDLNIGDQTLVNYRKWWNSYKSLNNSVVKNPVNNPSQITNYFRLNRKVESINTTSTEIEMFSEFAKSEIEYKMIG